MKLTACDITTIELEPLKGANIFSTKKDMIIAAIMYDAPVVCTFNDAKYRITLQELVGIIKEVK